MRKLETINDSSLGIKENIAALLAVLFSGIGGVVIFILEKKSDFARFHAVQSIIFFGGASLLMSLLGRIILIGGLINTALGFITFVGWIVLIINTYKGVWFEIPFVADLAKKLLGRTDEDL